MAITVKDETAGVVILTIDNNGSVAFGNGTPVNMLTLNGYGLIDINGHIINGVQSGTLHPASGDVVLQYQGETAGNPSVSVTISTAPEMTPTVQIDSDYPTDFAKLLGGNVNHAYTYECACRLSNVGNGQFTVTNLSHGTSSAIPTSSGEFNYRYL